MRDGDTRSLPHLVRLVRPGGKIREHDRHARALQLRTLLRSAQVGRMPDDGLVEPGMVVTVRFAADGSETTFLLGSRDLAALDPDLEMDLYSPTSPLGGAITGRYVGDTVSYTAPSGAQEITIVSAVPFG